MSHDYVPKRTRNPMVTTTTPWSTATAHLSHCKAQTETFVLICHMPMFQEKLSNPFTLFTFIIIVYWILNFYFSLKWTFPLNMDFVRNFLFIIVFLTFVFVYLTKWILNLNIEFRISSFLWSGIITHTPPSLESCKVIVLCINKQKTIHNTEYYSTITE